jgi:glycopeptide antibiotics resistance protein
MKRCTLERLARFLLAMTACCLIVGTWQPFDFQHPLGDLTWTPSPPSDFLWNIAAFLPVGIFGPLGFSRRPMGCIVVIVCASAFSLVLEYMQTMSVIRVASWIDVASNTLGAMIGAGAVTILMSNVSGKQSSTPISHSPHQVPAP